MQIIKSLSVVGLVLAVSFSTVVPANDSVSSANPLSTAVELTEEDRASAKPRMPMLEAHQLPEEVREMLQIDSSGVSTQAYGSAGHPFTTQRATTRTAKFWTIKQQPFAATGKLWMRTGGSWFVCTASVIDKGVLVTAAHCVWDFGGSPVDIVQFEPARHKSITPYGIFTATDWAVPTVYELGTDVCDPAAIGVVCENDIAVVVLQKLAGQYVAQAVTGTYAYKENNWGYVNFADGKKYAQLTQLGYPVSLDSGNMMIRTDSVGYQASPNNVIIGSDQTGGSSGGPWLMNFGEPPERRGDNPRPFKAGNNKVVATTGWGFTSPLIKVQGGSRFGKNTNFTVQSNIATLHAWACSTYPGRCY